MIKDRLGGFILPAAVSSMFRTKQKTPAIARDDGRGTQFPTPKNARPFGKRFFRHRTSFSFTGR
jgi:hypothetical protein